MRTIQERLLGVFYTSKRRHLPAGLDADELLFFQIQLS